MKLFKNKVGRPTNEMLEKRKIFKMAIISILLACITILVSSLILSNVNFNKLKGNINSGELESNYQNDNSSTPAYTFELYKKDQKTKLTGETIVLDDILEGEVIDLYLRVTNSTDEDFMFSIKDYDTNNELVRNRSCIVISPNSSRWVSFALERINEKSNSRNLIITSYNDIDVCRNAGSNADNEGTILLNKYIKVNFKDNSLNRNVVLDEDVSIIFYPPQRYVSEALIGDSWSYPVTDVETYNMKSFYSFKINKSIDKDIYYKFIITDTKKGTISTSSCEKINKPQKVITHPDTMFDKKSNSKKFLLKLYGSSTDCESDITGSNEIGTSVREDKIVIHFNSSNSNEGTGLLTVIAQFIVDIINWFKSLF